MLRKVFISSFMAAVLMTSFQASAAYVGSWRYHGYSNGTCYYTRPVFSSWWNWAINNPSYYEPWHYKTHQAGSCPNTW